jgi:hypothetical protein
MENQEYIRCFRNSFCSLFPEFKENDFKKMSHPWSIMTHQTGYAISINQTIDNKGIVLSYSVNIDTTISPYSEGDKALEEKDEEALKEYYNSYVGKRFGNGDIVTIPSNIKHYGKEDYGCIESESYRPAIGKYPVETNIKHISCGKSNPQKTKIKRVNIRLIYQKFPSLPEEFEELVKDYTYEDLKQRAQRMLDSLYIKDGW